MEKVTHEEILRRLARIANGDDYNDPQMLVIQLRSLANQAEILVIEEKSAK